jgi:hypothetical protein
MGLLSFFKSRSSSAARRVPCEVCGASASFLDAVDFNKSCEESKNIYLPTAGRVIDYYLCDACGFCFAPEFRDWTVEEFTEKIYNGDYVKVDPDYVTIRPTFNARALHERFGMHKGRLRHLDYGGGSGLLSQTLRENGWNSLSYDPIVEPDKDITELGVFDLITAYEVFEHVPHIDALCEHMARLCADDGIIRFTTLCSDGSIQRGQSLAWWYAAPRNGHISLHSRKSLQQMMSKYGFSLHSFSLLDHIAFRHWPDWFSAVQS